MCGSPDQEATYPSHLTGKGTGLAGEGPCLGGARNPVGFVGADVGPDVGRNDGEELGDPVGTSVGLFVAPPVGALVG